MVAATNRRLRSREYGRIGFLPAAKRGAKSPLANCPQASHPDPGHTEVPQGGLLFHTSAFATSSGTQRELVAGAERSVAPASALSEMD